MLVEQGAPAAKVLRTSDVIVAADGHKVTSVTTLRALLAKHRPGDVVRITFVRDGKRMTAAIKTVADPQDPKRALVGVSARDNLTVKLPVQIKIDAGGVGGPSAGLAFALDIAPGARPQRRRTGTRSRRPASSRSTERWARSAA